MQTTFGFDEDQALERFAGTGSWRARQEDEMTLATFQGCSAAEIAGTEAKTSEKGRWELEKQRKPLSKEKKRNLLVLPGARSALFPLRFSSGKMVCG